MREEYEKDKYNFLPSESEELHPTFKVDGKAFTWAQFDKRTPGRFKIETIKDKMISLCSKCIVHQILQKKKLNFHAKAYRKMAIILIINKFIMYYLINIMTK
jgi:hypothetical protein